MFQPESSGVHNEDLGTVFELDYNNFQAARMADFVDWAYSLYVNITIHITEGFFEPTDRIGERYLH